MRALIVIAGFLASGCASAPPAIAPAMSAAAATPARGLPAQTLSPGACALFLWDKADGAFVLFAEEGARTAQIWIDGAAAPATRTAFDGAVVGQTFTQQSFAAEGRAVSLSLTPGERIENGNRFPAGILTLSGADGWRVVVSVAGVRACQPPG